MVKCPKCFHQGWSESHCVCQRKEQDMTTDTIAIPAEIPREIRDGDKVLRVVGWEFGSLKTGDWYWCQSGQQYRKCYDSLQNTIFLKPIVEPVSRYIYPTPVEACRMIADAGGPIECESGDGQFRGRLGSVEINQCDGRPFRIDFIGHLTVKNRFEWVEKIRVLQPE